jgi:hypothetical protein
MQATCKLAKAIPTHELSEFVNLACNPQHFLKKEQQCQCLVFILSRDSASTGANNARFQTIPPQGQQKSQTPSTITDMRSTITHQNILPNTIQFCSPSEDKFKMAADLAIVQAMLSCFVIVKKQLSGPTAVAPQKPVTRKCACWCLLNINVCSPFLPEAALTESGEELTSTTLTTDNVFGKFGAPKAWKREA